ncbi:MAG: ATP-NAD kinase [Halanaeroarchaeum sp.]
MERERRTETATDIAVVGTDAAELSERIETAGARSAVVDPTGSAGAADAMVVSGESTLLARLREGVDVPLLPVEVGGGLDDVSADDLEAAVESYLAGECSIDERPQLVVAVDDDRYAALMDVMVVTEEAARISEFVVGNLVRDRTQTVDQVRADGVVVATSVGTPGYGTAAGGPVLGPETSGVAVVPIGPFRIEQKHWVLEPPISLTVARDDAPVSLLIDDEEVGPVPPHESIELSWGDPISLIRTPVSRSAFDRMR